MSTLLVVFIVGIVIILLVALAVFFVTRAVLEDRENKPIEELCGLGKKCPPTELCSKAGRCIPLGTCLFSSDCSDGEVCIDRACFPRTCQEGECGKKGVCEDGVCRSKCTTSNDCPGSEACVNEVCTPQHCLYQGDCSPDETCVGVTVPIYGEPPYVSLTKPSSSGICRRALNPCLTNLDCSPGLTCSRDKFCVQCSTSKECSGNENCFRGVCFAPTQSGCPGTEVLFNVCDGVSCPVYPVCCPRSCGVTCVGEVGSPSCPYCVAKKFICKPSPPVDLDLACSKDKPCLKNKLCVNGMCQEKAGVYGDRCTKDLDCSPAYVCSSIRGIDICVPSK